MKNTELEKTIESNILNFEKSLLKFSKSQLVLNFYQKKVHKFYVMQELVNMWESWKFFFILKKENNEQIHEVNNKQKENKIREYIYHVLEKVNFYKININR